MDTDVTASGRRPSRRLATLPFWPAFVIDLVLLFIAWLTVMNGSLIGPVVWFVFTVAWLVWTLIASIVNPPAAPKGSRPSDLSHLTPEQRQRWEQTEREVNARREAQAARLRAAIGTVAESPRSAGEEVEIRYVERTAEELLALRHRDLVSHRREPRTPRARAPKPEPLPLGVSHAGAEKLAEMWMKHLGVTDAEVTRFSQDGGIDVVSKDFVAQVKNYVGSVGAPEIQQLAGVMHTENRRGLFFTSGTYTVQAQTFADRAKIALFIYSAEQGELWGANEYATDAVAKGLPSAFGIDS